MIVSYRGESVIVDGIEVRFAQRVVDAFATGEVAVVLLDPDGQVSVAGQFHNLVALDRSGHRLWEAELPTTTTGDAYYAIASRSPLIALSVQSYDCKIDPTTGRLLEKTFTH